MYNAPMAQYRQSGGGLGFSNNSGVVRNGVASDHHVSIGIRSNKQHQSRNQHRRLKSTARKISIGAIIVILFVAFVVSVSAFFYFTSQNRGIICFYIRAFDYQKILVFSWLVVGNCKYSLNLYNKIKGK